jgi:hypothetical protein
MLVFFLLAGYALLVGDAMAPMLVTVQKSHMSRQAVLEMQLVLGRPFHLWKIAARGPIHVAE